MSSHDLSYHGPLLRGCDSSTESPVVILESSMRSRQVHGIPSILQENTLKVDCKVPLRDTVGSGWVPSTHLPSICNFFVILEASSPILRELVGEGAFVVPTVYTHHVTVNSKNSPLQNSPHHKLAVNEHQRLSPQWPPSPLPMPCTRARTRWSRSRNSSNTSKPCSTS